MAAVACFGEILLRLGAPGRELLLQSGRLEVHVGGAEANVAAGLARLGHDTRMISALPDNPLGDAALAALRGHGVECGSVQRRPGRMGLYFLSPGAGLRAADIIYDRTDSSFAMAPAAAFDWGALLQGVDRLHLSGITPALGPASAAAAIAAAEAASAQGVAVSFDVNYRARLWEGREGDARGVLARLVGHADILFGNHRDVALLLGRRFEGDGATRRREAAEAAFAHFPRLAHIASTARKVIDADCHRLSARIDTRADEHQTAEIALPGIVDRIGAGDAFAAGVVHALASGGDPAAMASSGLALACLKHSLPGDMSRFAAADIDAFQRGMRDVRR